MATLSAFSVTCICRRTNSSFSSKITPCRSSLSFHITNSRKSCKVVSSSVLKRLSKIRSSREIVNTQQEEAQPPLSSEQQPVSVFVSPSDILNMFFQAEGTMTETTIPIVANALEETEGISNLKVHVIEGIATVELTKQTTVQATGVASSLVETIQGSGFKLQTLNLSFEDEEDIE